jgi:hypothetical protein
MQGLDEQVQEIKSDVLRIAAELSLLEERLLYPSGTQVAVFVSLAQGEAFQLDSVQIQIVSVVGKLPGGQDFNGSRSFTFSKDVEPKLVGITLAGYDTDDAAIQLGDW